MKLARLSPCSKAASTCCISRARCASTRNSCVARWTRRPISRSTTCGSTPAIRGSGPSILPIAFERGQYDVYVLGDVDASLFTAEELRRLANVVKQGAGLAMLGGFHSFGPGGYADTPLADLLPVAMDARERQRLGDAIRSDVQLAGPLAHAAGQTAGRATLPDGLGRRARRWSGLGAACRRWKAPTGLGAGQADRAGFGREPERQPLLVVARGRRTRDGVCRRFDLALVDGRFRRTAQAVLATSGVVAGARMNGRRQRLDQLAQRSALARASESNSPPEPARPMEKRWPMRSLTPKLIMPDKTTQKINLRAAGRPSLGHVFDDAQRGGRLHHLGDCPAQRRAVGSAKSRFLVFEQDLELDNAVADPTLLASLSAMTKDDGGRSMAPEELSDLLRRMKEKPLDLEVQTQVKHTPWDTWPFFLLFVGADQRRVVSAKEVGPGLAGDASSASRLKPADLCQPADVIRPPYRCQVPLASAVRAPRPAPPLAAAASRTRCRHGLPGLDQRTAQCPGLDVEIGHERDVRHDSPIVGLPRRHRQATARSAAASNS